MTKNPDTNLGQDASVVQQNKVKIKDQSEFCGTGFFISTDCCLTCHHVICQLDKIKVEHNGRTYDAKWIKDSPKEKDLAFLKVKDANVIPLKCAEQITPSKRVSIYGYSQATNESLRDGIEVLGLLGDVPGTYTPTICRNMKFRNEWNETPQVNVKVYTLHKFNSGGLGLSGAPVYEKNRRQIVGVCLALQGPDPARDITTVGYAIPIEDPLDFAVKIGAISPKQVDAILERDVNHTYTPQIDSAINAHYVIAISGSWKEERAKEWNLENGADFAFACEELGKKIARELHGATVIVHSDKPDSADYYIIRGIVNVFDGGVKKVNVLIVTPRGARSGNKCPYVKEVKKFPWNFFYPIHEVKTMTEAHIKAIDSADVLITVGGTSTTNETGLKMIKARKRILPIGCFGGASRKLLFTVLEKMSSNQKLYHDFTELNGTWSESLLDRVIRLISSPNAK
jgi:hypothetical protein